MCEVIIRNPFSACWACYEYTYIGFIDYFFILGLLKVVFNYLFFSKYVVSLHHNVFCFVEIHFCPHFTVRHETIKNIQ